MNKTKYLVHHGILGQKWGIRRYQNEDSSLTAQGRQRYGEESNGRYPWGDGQGYNQQNQSSSQGQQKSFVQRHKKALIVGGVVAAAVAVSVGKHYVESKRNAYVGDIIKGYDKQWAHKTSKLYERMKREGKGSLIAKSKIANDAKYDAFKMDILPKLSTMKYSELAKQALGARTMSKYL